MKTLALPIAFALPFLLCAAGGCTSVDAGGSAGSRSTGVSSSGSAAAASSARAASSDAARVPAPLPALSKSDPVYAYVTEMRDDLSRGKVDSINTVMHLSADEAKAFWPIYQEYEDALFDLGDRRLELIRRFVTAQDAGQLDNAQATELADGYFRYEAERLDLLKKYHGEIAKALSPLRAAQFAQIEHRVSTVIDLLIASELPLARATR